MYIFRLLHFSPQASPERDAADAELRAGLVRRIDLKHALDQCLFHLFQGEPERDLEAVPLAAHAACAEQFVQLRCVRCRVAEAGKDLSDVAQLADVARPGVGEQALADAAPDEAVEVLLRCVVRAAVP